MAVFGKKIVFGVCGSIAAFKVAGWVSRLTRKEILVDVVMTEAGRKFVAPLTFSSLSGRKVHTGMFSDDGSMHHIELGTDADLLVIAPATADTLARLACGMANDLLTTTALVARCPKLLFPAMNPRMYEHPATQNNVEILRRAGYRIVEPACGTLACRDNGIGRLVDWEVAEAEILRGLTVQDLSGLKIVISAGPTREAIDPARFISNRSSGKMGYALARVASMRGAEVVVVSGPTSLPTPENIELVSVESAQEMFDAVMSHADSADVIIKAAAVSDHRPKQKFEHKIKKNDLGEHIDIVRNPDILFSLGQQKRPGQILVGFAAESKNLEQEGKRKLSAKNLDIIAVNDISSARAGFEIDTNEVLLLDAAGEKELLPLLSKEETASRILDKVVTLRG